jgi:hypothetical protein
MCQRQITFLEVRRMLIHECGEREGEDKIPCIVEFREIADLPIAALANLQLKTSFVQWQVPGRLES